MYERKAVSDFYDEYVSHQKTVAFNERHYAIMDAVQQAGLTTNSQVLELGCGIGVLTQLLAKKVTGGAVTAVDISPKSIEHAKEAVSRFQHVQCEVADVTDKEHMSSYGTYDYILACDMLEHIPLEHHNDVFAIVKEHLSSNGTFFVNTPTPAHIEYLMENDPGALQLIDLPIHVDTLLHTAYQNGFVLKWFRSCSIWHPDDYQMMVFQLKTPFDRSPIQKDKRLSWLPWPFSRRWS